MNLNHEIITFQDVDINTSKIKMRMMLRGGKIIKKYKFVELNLKTLNKNIKEKKLLNFPYKSKFTFNYNLTDDKATVSQFIKDAKFSRENKKNKSIFESNDDDDENCEEESEDSNKEKDDNNSKTLSFKQRLNIFEKEGKIEKKSNNTIKPEIKKRNTNLEKNEKNQEFLLKIKQYENMFNI